MNCLLGRVKQVKEGGTIFFRESCFRQSGDAKRSNNPTHYRNPRNYFAIFDSAEVGESQANLQACCCWRQPCDKRSTLQTALVITFGCSSSFNLLRVNYRRSKRQTVALRTTS